MKMRRSLVWLVLILCAANVAVSEVVAYDTFHYEVGEIVGQSAPAYGFTGAWGGGGGNVSQCTVQAASLVYPGADAAIQDGSGMAQVRVAVFEGGRAGRFFDTDPNGPFGEYINAQGTIGKPGQTVYVSYLMKTSATNPFFALEFKNGDLGDGGARLYIGNDVGGSNLQVCAYRNRDQSPANMGKEFQWLGAATTNTELFVVRFDFGATSDNVTVYRNPSPESEPVITPHLVGSRFLDFDAITLAAWVDPGGRTVQFDEICVATTYADAVRFYNHAGRAQNPAPADGSVDLPADAGVTLSWEAGTAAPSGYKVYFSDVLDEVLGADDAAYVGTTASTSLPVAAIDTDTTYYWSVTSITEPNDVPGVVWTFDTVKTYPVVISQPASQQVVAGETASFTYDVDSISQPYYQWFDANGALADSGDFSGTQTASLVIANAQAAYEGEYYCQVTNLAGTVTSHAATLRINRLVGHWNLNQPAGSDPNVAWQDLSGTGNDLQPLYTIPETYVWTEGADGTENGALVFDLTYALGTKKADGTMKAIPVGNEPFTISLWFKMAQQTNFGAGLIGWGNYGNFNQCNAIARYNNASNWVTNYWWDKDMSATRGYSLTDDNWHQVVVTYDGTTRVIYIDGIQAATDSPAPHNVQTSENFLVGKANSLTSMAEFFEGALDDVKVYNYALAKIEVAKSYTDIRGGELCAVPPAMDLNGDCVVDLSDVAEIAANWLECGLVPTCLE